MAKNTHSRTNQHQARERIARTEIYADKVRALFAECVNDILKAKRSLDELPAGVMYSFDGDNAKVRRKVEQSLRELHALSVYAIESGIKMEWERANKEADKLLVSCFGKDAATANAFKAWQSHNTAAMRQFMKRKENAVTLSDRVWKSVDQLRQELEVALTIGIGEASSAAELSRKVRQYLNEPDLMFRRFRYKDEDGSWRKKWKKKYKDENGRTRWMDFDKDDYPSGRGVYKSAYKNAMRVTRTETNMAYRRAEQARWEQMDFVRGYRISLSRSHPKYDICNDLAGDYPKSFKFDGWHPHCFCVSTPILATEEEMLEMTAAKMDGREYTPPTPIGENKALKEFIEKSKSHILDARAYGKEPYFLRHNQEYVDNVFRRMEETRTEK